MGTEVFIDVLTRWGHTLFGIAWIGLLYYFNFVQGSAFKELEASSRTDAFTKLVPRALWWFRWAAMFTFLTGVLLLYFRGMATTTYIAWGSVMAIIMFLNVWLIIWPNQRIVIASNEAVQGGGEADPNAAAAAAKALLASRTNTLFSLPMLFFMTFSAHAPGIAGQVMSISLTNVIILGAIILAIEANAIWGKMQRSIESVRAVIISSLVLTAAMAYLANML